MPGNLGNGQVRITGESRLDVFPGESRVGRDVERTLNRARASSGQACAQGQVALHCSLKGRETPGGRHCQHSFSQQGVIMFAFNDLCGSDSNNRRKAVRAERQIRRGERSGRHRDKPSNR